MFWRKLLILRVFSLGSVDRQVPQRHGQGVTGEATRLEGRHPNLRFVGWALLKFSMHSGDHGSVNAHAHETMLELLGTSTDGAAIRRGWLEALAHRFDAQLGAAQNIAYDVAAETLRYADNVSVGPKEWQDLDALMDGAPLPDIGSAEQLAAMNAFAAYRETDVPPPLAEMIWRPHQLASSLSSNVMEDGRMMGHISIFRTASASEQFEGNEMRGEGKAWAECSFKLMSATHAMLCRGPRKRGAMLYKPDGSGWMQSELPVDWASRAYLEELARTVKHFAVGDEHERELHSHNTRVRLSRVAGNQEQGILVIAEPMAVPKVSELSQLSPVERLVSSYAANGATIDAIAVLMSRSAATIKSHLQNIYVALGIGSRAELATLYETAMDWKPQ